MDSKRGGRTVIDPKIRQVGFFTPQPPPDMYHSGPMESMSSAISDISPASNSLSPVMIPPPRHASDLLSLRRPRTADDMPVGSYNPSDSILSSSPAPCPKFRDGELPEGSSNWFHAGNCEKFGSFPSGGFDLTTARASDSQFKKPIEDTVPTEMNSGEVVEVQDEMTLNSKVVSAKPLKERTTRAERRALQEAQREAKGSTKGGGKAEKGAKQAPQKKDAFPVAATNSDRRSVDRAPEKDRKKDVPPPRMQFDDKSRVEKAKKRAVVQQTEAKNRVELFRHLPQYEHGTQLPILESKFFHLDPMHPAVYKIGLQYLVDDIFGGNARCIAMLRAFQEAIKDYSTPPQKTLPRDLTARLSSFVSFLIECRPLSISMGNAIRFLKGRVAKLPLNLPESEAKTNLCSDIDRFINEKIVLADNVIVRHAVTKIRDGDVLLTYGSSCVVEMILLYAHGLGRNFRVVVVDSRPRLEGQALLRRLVRAGLKCTYTHVNAVSYIMHEVSRVFLGAASVLSNGTVYSRVGSAGVAMVAHAFRVPVLICCEAYKFHERVQLDSICFNELGDPHVIGKIPKGNGPSVLGNSIDEEHLQLLNLTYDVTPSDYISMIVTDYGMIPPTSVPVIVREYRREQLWI